MERSVFLMSPSERGKVLSVENDELCYLPPSEDSVWVTRPAKKGFHILSSRSNKALHYDPQKDEKVTLVPYDNENATEWHITDRGEIYTKTLEKEKKYLWNISDGVYVTPDEYLAENWRMVSIEGFDLTKDVADKHPRRFPLWFWLLAATVIIAVLYLLFKK